MRGSPDFVAIRPIELDDAQAICDAMAESKEDLGRWWPVADPEREKPERERARIAERIQSRAEGTAFAFVIFDLRNGTILGRCGINFIAKDPGFANLGYWVRTSRRGQGVAPAAVRQLARFGFEQVGLVRLELVIDVDNAASIRVAEKAGAVFEGVLRNRVVGQTGEPRPARMYSLVPENPGQ